MSLYVMKYTFCVKKQGLCRIRKVAMIVAWFKLLKWYLNNKNVQYNIDGIEYKTEYSWIVYVNKIE